MACILAWKLTKVAAMADVFYANSIAGKPIDTKTDMKDQTDIMTKFLDEAKKADSQTNPSVKDAVERSADQVETTSFDINDMQTAFNLQKSEHEPNIKDKVTTHKDDEMDAEPLGSQIPAPEMNESVEKGQLQLLTGSDETFEMLSDVVSQDDNEDNAEVHIQKEHHSSLGSNLHDNADSKVEMEKVKKEMKAMEAALLGTARQAQRLAALEMQMVPCQHHGVILARDRMRKQELCSNKIRTEPTCRQCTNIVKDTIAIVLTESLPKGVYSPTVY
ncbi:hypothetical protein Tco_1053568 [Tanacetum coccineum]|uniref:Uncharacterized protein n=1 Tax=Tanacetum coccineum TaxID=301880 RepID=A0ABQ5GVI0_9ASTR